MFNKLSNGDIESILKEKYNIEISTDKLDYAGGSLKVAIELGSSEDNKYLKLDELYSCYKKSNMLGAIKCIEQITFKDDETFNYLEYLFMQDKLYNIVPIIEKTRNRMKQNANEDIVKQMLNICIMKGGN